MKIDSGDLDEIGDLDEMRGYGLNQGFSQFPAKLLGKFRVAEPSFSNYTSNVKIFVIELNKFLISFIMLIHLMVILNDNFNFFTIYNNLISINTLIL